MTLPLRVDAGRRRSRVAVPQIYSDLRAQIVSIRLKPGVGMSESRIADHYGVSRTPVREAFKRLADDGLLRVVPQVGSFVARIDLQAVRDSHFVRETLECRIAELAAERINDDEREQLARNLRELASARATGDAPAMFIADEAMHAMLARFARHQHAWQVIQTAKAQLDRVRHLGMAHPGRPRETLREHRAIAERVMARDPHGAAEAMRAHLVTVIEVLGDIASSHADYFEEPVAVVNGADS
jgi:DNA-binding GntR family transcriptional regulator